ncbi:uncharacterized protein LOC124498367 [Dermatophagoides farinae]|uniref:uncharacterized protein LOC124498367 n=1 Tax=Dermatophagoides farinae TaxID=6954 RepID=UPI003F63612C
MVVAFDQQSDFIDHQQSAPLVVVQEKFKCFINNTQQLNWKNILIPDHNMKSMDSFATKFINNNDMNQKEMKNKISTTMTKVTASKYNNHLHHQHHNNNNHHQQQPHHLNSDHHHPQQQQQHHHYQHQHHNQQHNNSKLIMSSRLSSLSLLITIFIIMMMMIFHNSCVMGNSIKFANRQPKLLKIANDNNNNNNDNNNADDALMMMIYSNTRMDNDDNDNDDNFNQQSNIQQRIGSPSSSSSSANQMRFKILKQLRLNNNNDKHRRVHHHHSHHNSESRLIDDPIFDPTIEEFSLDSSTRPKQQQSMVADNNGKQFDNKPIKLDIDDSGDDNNYNNNISDSKSGKQHSLLFDNAGVDEVDSVKKIIDSGWIQHSSTKKLLYYLRKIDEVLFKDAGLGGDATDVVDDLLSFEDVDDSFTPDKDEIMNNKPKNVDKVMENNKNFEIILNRMMNTPTVVKKRGEGPQLSIDYPLTVLRQRLMAELARRKAKETEEQIAINTEILKKLGRRRRRRRSISPITNHPISNHREQYTMAHRYPTLNKHQRFRNNNKYFAYDRLINDIGNSSTTNIKRQIRINSKKQSWPIINRLNYGGDKRV